MRAFGKVWLSIGLISIALGICLLILAGVSGFTMRRGDTYSLSEEYPADIRSLDFQIDSGRVRIVEGDTFRIDASGLSENGDFDSQVKDGVWTIRESGHNQLNIFGLRVPAISIFGKSFDPDIMITIPEDFIAEDVRFNLGAGNLDAGRIRSKTGSFTVDAGEMVLKELDIREQSDYNIGVGYMGLHNANLKNITLDCSVGYVNIEGIIIGDSDIECGIGKIQMNLEGDIRRYSYDIGGGITNVSVNGKNYFGGMDRGAYEDALGSFSMECGIGNITLDMN